MKVYLFLYTFFRNCSRLSSKDLETAAKRVHLYNAINFKMSERQRQMQKREMRYSYYKRMLQESLGLVIAVKRIHLYITISFKEFERQRQVEKREKTDICYKILLQESSDRLHFQLCVLNFVE